MPQLRQSIKALRQNKKRALKNYKVREDLKNTLKKSRKAIEAKAGEADQLVRDTVQKLDKAVKNGLVKKNTAARRKSRLMKKLNASKK